MKVAEGLGECLDAETGLAVAEAAVGLESPKGKGNDGTKRGIGENTTLDEAEIGCVGE